jgi:phosphoribosylformimino-5-aminoimidazole carboxamide ribotide isomerase
MIILPAIDIKDGNCVRLFKGDYATVQKVAESPYIAAQGFADAGAEWMHMVDLDGSLKKEPVLLRMLQKLRDFLLRSAEESVI